MGWCAVVLNVYTERSVHNQQETNFKGKNVLNPRPILKMKLCCGLSSVPESLATKAHFARRDLRASTPHSVVCATCRPACRDPTARCVRPTPRRNARFEDRAVCASVLPTAKPSRLQTR